MRHHEVQTAHCADWCCGAQIEYVHEKDVLAFLQSDDRPEEDENAVRVIESFKTRIITIIYSGRVLGTPIHRADVVLCA